MKDEENERIDPAFFWLGLGILVIVIWKWISGDYWAAALSEFSASPRSAAVSKASAHAEMAASVRTMVCFSVSFAMTSRD